MLRKQHTRSRFSGMSMAFAIFSMAAILGLCSLGVDYGRVQLAKSELRTVVDSAARYCVTGIRDGGDELVRTVRQRAKQLARENTVDGVEFKLKNSDIEFGLWDSNSKTFTVLNGSSRSSANAVRITGYRTADRNGAVPLTFASIIGYNEVDLQVSAIAMIRQGVDVEHLIPATANPWLAGMPNGTISNPGNPHNNPDYAPAATPTEISGLSIDPGSAIGFDTIGGNARHDPNLDNYDPDGNLGHRPWFFGGAEHGKSSVRAPINSLIGVFLSDERPDYTPPPPNLDFDTAESRNFSTLRPKLKQVFFIGDGQDDNGNQQEFVVPDGATRLYIGMMDGYEWSNNYGEREVRIKKLGNVKIVR